MDFYLYLTENGIQFAENGCERSERAIDREREQELIKQDYVLKSIYYLLVLVSHLVSLFLFLSRFQSRTHSLTFNTSNARLVLPTTITPTREMHRQKTNNINSNEYRIRFGSDSFRFNLKQTWYFSNGSRSFVFFSRRNKSFRYKKNRNVLHCCCYCSSNVWSM